MCLFSQSTAFALFAINVFVYSSIFSAKTIPLFKLMAQIHHWQREKR